MLESPSERAAYKEFARTFRATENQVSLDAARNYALASIDRNNQLCLPLATHWRVHLELADVAKRSNRIADARAHYQQACRLQPKANQGWLEHSKLEEESGNLDKCAVILQKGLDKLLALKSRFSGMVEQFMPLLGLDASIPVSGSSGTHACALTVVLSAC